MNMYGNFVNPVGRMKSARVSLGTTPQLIATDNANESRPMYGRRGVVVSLPEESPAATVYIGDKTVAIGEGLPVCAGNGLILPLNGLAGAGNIYMVADTECSVLITEWTE